MKFLFHKMVQLLETLIQKTKIRKEEIYKISLYTYIFVVSEKKLSNTFTYQHNG